MPEQPQTMVEMIESVRTASARGDQSVIPTIATHEFIELGTDQRRLLNDYNDNAMAQYMGLSLATPGMAMQVHQTDHWYRTHDHNGTFATFVSNVQRISRETR